VILLVGLEGMSYEAAAQILDVPVGTVRSRLSRGRDALRQLMDMPERTQSAGGAARFCKHDSGLIKAAIHGRPLHANDEVS
jgi:hypothetical protein